jgi:hypothetical protein
MASALDPSAPLMVDSHARGSTAAKSTNPKWLQIRISTAVEKDARKVNVKGWRDASIATLTYPALAPRFLVISAPSQRFQCRLEQRMGPGAVMVITRGAAVP